MDRRFGLLAVAIETVIRQQHPVLTPESFSLSGFGREWEDGEPGDEFAFEDPLVMRARLQRSARGFVSE